MNKVRGRRERHCLRLKEKKTLVSEKEKKRYNEN